MQYPSAAQASSLSLSLSPPPPPHSPPSHQLQLLSGALSSSSFERAAPPSRPETMTMRVAVVGAGISGLAAAHTLAIAGVEVVLYEKEERLGGTHAKTIAVNGVDVDLGFLAFKGVADLDVVEMMVTTMGAEALQVSPPMSSSVSLDGGKDFEWGTRGGLSSLFAQRSNAANPNFWRLIREIAQFKDDVRRYLEELENNPDMHHRETLGHFIKAHGYSDLFQRAYLIPICSSIWSCPSERVLNLSAYSVLVFCHNHHVLQLFGQPQYLTVKGYSHCYVSKITRDLENRHCQIKTGSLVESVSSTHGGCSVLCMDGSEDVYDGCIISVHAPDALKILGKQSTYEEMRILDAFQYVSRDMFLHRDKGLMPHNPSVWSSWNFIGNTSSGGCVTYWLNLIQNLGSAALPFFVTLSPPQTPNDTLLKWTTSHPIPSVAAVKALHELEGIQGNRKIWFSGVYLGHGFHEDAYKAGVAAAHAVIGKSRTILRSKNLFVPSLAESGARCVVTRFLRHYIIAGCLILLEDGGTAFLFEGTKNKSQRKIILMTVHNPHFFLKIASGADLGLASAYIDGDFSFVDKQEGLLDFLMMLIENRDLRKSSQRRSFTSRDWWIPQIFFSAIGSAHYLLFHTSMKNTITQARRNISQHYDLSCDLFSIFLGESMIYSCAIFESEEEDLKDAQLRKVSRIIEKLGVNSSHDVLEFGCGWGSFAVEIVKQTGCKYTGITLSEEQVKYSTRKAKEAGLEDSITFLLCDYRQLASTRKFDRIVCMGMFEAVGHEYMEEFFSCCDSYLAEDGVFVLQTITIPDERYDECRRNPEFLTERFFPGVCLPSLSRITSAMAAACASRLCVEHVENIGRNYYRTLKCWRDNFMARRSEVLELGFDEKFIRTWEYSFNYCAAGFKSRSFGTYQIVFSRPGNLKMFGDDRPELLPSGH